MTKMEYKKKSDEAFIEITNSIIQDLKKISTTKKWNFYTVTQTLNGVGDYILELTKITDLDCQGFISELLELKTYLLKIKEKL